MAAVAAALAWAVSIMGVTALLTRYAEAARAPATISIHTLEFKFEPQGDVQLKAPASGSGHGTLVVGAGEIVFRVTNAGAIEHNFIIWDKNQRTLAEIPVLAAGETQEVRVRLQPGEYTIICTYPGHTDLGMILALQVK